VGQDAFDKRDLQIGIRAWVREHTIEGLKQYLKRQGIRLITQVGNLDARLVV
jgi:hypothetical protein